MLDVRIAFTPDLHGVPVDACNHTNGGKWSTPKASTQSFGSQRNLGSGECCVEFPLTVRVIFHMDCKVAIRPMESPLMLVVHRQERGDVKLLGKIKGSLTF